MRRILGVCVVSLLVACGGGSGGGDAGDVPANPDVPTVTDDGVPDVPTPTDEGGQDTPIPPDEGATDPGNQDIPIVPDEGPDSETPPPVTVEPPDGAVGVSVLAPIVVTLERDVTSAANDATTSLAWARGFNETVWYGLAVDGALSIQGKTVTFTPNAPLAAGTTYRFFLSGVTTADGPVPNVVVTFRTWDDPIAYQVSWETATEIRQHAIYDYDDGDLVGLRLFDEPGLDGIWRNDDDVQDSRSAYSGLEQGHWTRHVSYNGPGTDAQWGTDDDVLRYHQLRTFDENGQNTGYDSYSGLGSDGVPFSGDEPYGFRQQKTFDGRGQLIRSFQPTAPGPDTTWFTGDDTAPSYAVHEYDDAGRRTRTLSMMRGTDNLFFTDDDVIGGYTEYTLLPDGRLDRYVDVGNPGPDATWFTQDDTDRWPTVYTFDDAKLLATEAWYDNTDVMGGYTEYDHDSEGRMTAQRRYDAGPDGTFGTGDDFVQVQWIYVLP